MRSPSPSAGIAQRQGAANSKPATFTWQGARADARRRAANRDAMRLLSGLVGIADVVSVIGLSLLAFVLRNGVQPVSVEIVAISALASVLLVNGLSLSGAYSRHLRDSFVAQVMRAGQAWTLVCFLLLTLGLLTKTMSDYARTWAVLWYAFVLVGFMLTRTAAVQAVRLWRAQGRLTATIAIVDLTGRGAELARRLAAEADCRLLGVFYLDNVAPQHRGLSDLIGLSRLFRLDEVFVLVSDQTNTAGPQPLSALLRRLGTIPTNVRLCPLLLAADDTPIRGTAMIHRIPVLTVHRRPLGTWSSVVKRAEDVMIGSIALFLLCPLMAIVAAAIKLDSPGPVLFRQARQGFNDNVITVLKFRSMTHRPTSNGAVAQAVRNDPRVTRVGRFLRRTSLDELPQIFNVLRGEMSLVGPRPHAVIHNQHYAALIDDYLGRHRVQPGITGWAQVNGFRGETETVLKMQKRVEYDLFYIDNWSIFLDLKIILMTAMSLVANKDVY